MSDRFSMKKRVVYVSDWTIIVQVPTILPIISSKRWRSRQAMKNVAGRRLNGFAISSRLVTISRRWKLWFCMNFIWDERFSIKHIQFEQICKLLKIKFQLICQSKNFSKEHFWWTKLCWLIRRWFIDILRNPPIQTVRILQKIVTLLDPQVLFTEIKTLKLFQAISAIIGFCYFGTDNTTQSGIQSIQGVAFVFVSENTFPPMYSVLDEFPHNYPLFLREYKSGLYSPAIYYLSRIIAMVR